MKLGKAKLDLLFLQSCKKRNVVPKFLRFKVASKKLRRSTAYYQCQKKLLDEEIKIKKDRIQTLETLATNAYDDLSSRIRTIDLIHLKSVSDKENLKTIERHQKIQEKKLLRLCPSLVYQETLNPDNVIFNYSSRALTPEEKNLLAKGLNFSIPNNKLDYCDFLLPFEFLHRQLKKENLDINSGFTEDHVKTKLKDIALSGYKNFSPPNFLLTREDYQILKGLKDDKTIHITKPDKGNGVVLINKMLDILADASKFRPLQSAPLKTTIKREKDL